MSTVESMWYAARPYPPKARRLSRLPPREQYGMGIDLAIDFKHGKAGYRNFGISLTGEVYWHWPRPESATGWWLLPQRTHNSMRLAQEYAEMRARNDARRGLLPRDEHGCARLDGRIEMYLRRLQRAAQRAKRRPIDPMEYVFRKQRKSLEEEIKELWSMKGAAPIRGARMLALAEAREDRVADMHRRYAEHLRGVAHRRWDEPFWAPIASTIYWIGRRHKARR